MSRSRKFGAVIARRRLTIVGASRRVVFVSIGQPRRMPGTSDWECPFRISGAGLRLFDCGYGVDAMQALITALGGIRFRLDSMGKSFSWLGTQYTGFDRSIPFWGDAAATRRLERLVDREVLRYVRELKRKHDTRSRQHVRRRVNG